jgi:hypothetical protein
MPRRYLEGQPRRREDDLWRSAGASWRRWNAERREQVEDVAWGGVADAILRAVCQTAFHSIRCAP